MSYIPSSPFSCPPQHPISHQCFLSTQEPAAPGGNPSWAESTVKSGRLRDINMLALLSAAAQTHQPYLELHMRQRETEDMQSSILTCTLVALVLTLKVSHNTYGNHINFQTVLLKHLKTIKLILAAAVVPAVQEINKTANTPWWKGYKQACIRQTNGSNSLFKPLFSEWFFLSNHFNCYCGHTVTETVILNILVNIKTSQETKL